MSLSLLGSHCVSLTACLSLCVSLRVSHCLALVDGFLWVLPTIVKEELKHATVAQSSASVAPEPADSDVMMEVCGAIVSLLYLFAPAHTVHSLLGKNSETLLGLLFLMRYPSS